MNTLQSNKFEVVAGVSPPCLAKIVLM